MNNQEAKFILSAYRSNGADAGDPLFAEALKQAQQDPTLGAWFGREQAHDRATAQKLASIQAPAGLREAILTGARVSGGSRSMWRQPIWIGLAAAAAVLIAVTASFWPKKASAEDRVLATFALKDTAHENHDGHGAEVKNLQAMLGNPAMKLRSGLAIDFEALRGTGCRTVMMNGHEVFEVCFNRNGSWFHLYAIRDPAAAAGRSANVSIAQQEKLACATWSDGRMGYRYAVVGDAGLEAVRNLL